MFAVFCIEYNFERKTGPLTRCRLICRGFSSIRCRHATCVCSWRAGPMAQLQKSFTLLRWTHYLSKDSVSAAFSEHEGATCCRVIAKMQGRTALVNVSLFGYAFQDHRCYCKFGYKKPLQIQVFDRTMSACIARGRIMPNQLLP